MAHHIYFRQSSENWNLYSLTRNFIALNCEIFFYYWIKFLPAQKLKYIYYHHIDVVVILITLSETSIDDKEIVKCDKNKNNNILVQF